MKKGQVCLYFVVAALMFVAVFLSGFLSCGAENCFSLLDKAQDETFEGYEGGRYVYVGGAVESSGWFFMRDGATYGELLAAAGELSETVAPEYISSLFHARWKQKNGHFRLSRRELRLSVH